MKKLTLLNFLVFGLLLQCFAQKRIVERSFATDPEDELQLDLKFGETISVKSWDQDRIAFKAVIEINQGKLNDALEVDFNQGGHRLKIAADYDKSKVKAGRREDCPDDRYPTYSWHNGDNGRYTICSRISYELFVPPNIELDVETISGDIELVDLAGPIRAKSISGFVDLSWAERNSANIDIKTVSGEAFTNLGDIQFENKKDHVPLVGYTLRGKIGQRNGPRVSLESVSGNIYLRKSKS